MIRVGRRIYNRNGTYTDPHYDNFTPILCLTKSTEYGALGPYELKDDKGRIMENIWQFSKVYKKVGKAKESYSRYQKDLIIWEHGEEVHVDQNNNLTKEYFNWRKKGMENKYAVRYPVGFGNMKDCLYALCEDNNGNIINSPLNYIQARKAIYEPVYKNLVKNQPLFNVLIQKLKNKENLLIIEVDGPHQEALEYYKTTYGVLNNFIEQSTTLATKENLDIFLNDGKFPYGHGYCLASALLENI